MSKKIKWASLQPLTGGMYLGCEEAIGHPAEFIMSYKGLDKPKLDKSGQIVDAGNEYHLLNYLEKKNRSVPYYQFDREMFQEDMDLDPSILKDGVKVEHPDYSDLDLVVAVPVCAGISSATNQSEDRKDLCNNNMLYLANYTLNVIKPKIYIFENAPRFLTPTAHKVRTQIEEIAKNCGYSIIYYKTDTKFHNNCQQRPRTFIYFIRNESQHQGTTTLNFENKPATVEEVLSKIPSDATQQVTVDMSIQARAVFEYMPIFYGDNWHEKCKVSTIIDDYINQGKLDDWHKFAVSLPWLTEANKKSIDNYVKHIKDKNGKKFWRHSVTYSGTDNTRAAMFRTIPSALHYKEDRLYTVREWLTLMGMPYDFEMIGNINKTYSKIGQNVPVKTAKFIVHEAKNLIENWNTFERNDKNNILLVDNIHKKVEELS